MTTELEKKVSLLEKELNDLKKLVNAALQQKDWRKTLGLSADDPGFDEMVRLGAEARRQEQEPDDDREDARAQYRPPG